MTAIVFAVVYLNVDELSRRSTNHAVLAEKSYSSEAASIVSQNYSSSDFVASGSTSPSGGTGTNNAVLRMHFICYLLSEAVFSYPHDSSLYARFIILERIDTPIFLKCSTSFAIDPRATHKFWPEP
jgi:hypothetical protein